MTNIGAPRSERQRRVRLTRGSAAHEVSAQEPPLEATHLQPPRSPPHAHARSPHASRSVPGLANRGLRAPTGFGSASDRALFTWAMDKRGTFDPATTAAGLDSSADLAHARVAEHGRVRCGFSSVGS